VKTTTPQPTPRPSGGAIASAGSWLLGNRRLMRAPLWLFRARLGLLADYTTRHRRAWARFKPVIEATLGAPITEHDTNLPMVGFRLSNAGSEPS
jgi:hypothetical protein